MGEVKKHNHKKRQNVIFTPETLGVILILFSALAMVCLITKDKVFSVPGDFVCRFLTGAFGYFAVAVVLWVFVFGIMLVQGKELNLTIKGKILCTLFFLLVSLLLNVISLREYSSLSYGKYLSKAYEMGNGGLSTASAGGIVLSTVGYFFPHLLTNIGAYVVCAIAVIVDVYAIFYDIKKLYGIPSHKKVRSSFVPNGAEAGALSNNLEERDYPVNLDFAETDMEGKQKLFVNNPKDFEFKTKREKRKGEGDIVKIDYEKGGLGVGNPTEQQIGNTLEEKVKYVKSTPKIDIDRLLNKSQFVGFENLNNDNNYGGYNVGFGSTSLNGYMNENYNNSNGDGVNISKPIKDYGNNDKLENSSDNLPPEIRTVENIPYREHNEFENTALAHAREFSEKYSDIPDDGGKSFTVEPSVINSRVPNTSFNREGTHSSNEKSYNKVEETNRPSDYSFNEEKVEDAFSFNQVGEIDNEGEPIINEEIISEPEMPIIEEPPVSRIRETSRSLFDKKEESIKEEREPSFDVTSGRRRGINFNNPLEETEKEGPPIAKKEEKKKAPPINRKYNRPPLDLLETNEMIIDEKAENHQENLEIIKNTLEEFHVNAEPVGFSQGPAITRYEIKMPSGVSVKRVVSFDADLRSHLKSKDEIRIEAPIPGKDLVGIEVANKVRVKVGLKEIMESQNNFDNKKLMFALGKDLVGNCIFDNLAKGPHYLVAGATGSGKSVCLNVMILSMIMRYSPEELRLILVDPKGVEFSVYEHLPHLMIDEIITDTQRTINVLQWAYNEMERRYQVFHDCVNETNSVRVPDIESYNERIASATVPKMPRIVIIIDELADLMLQNKRDMETKIMALANKSRAVGIHLVLATQRPSVDIITGTIKANLPSRIALKVMNYADSSTILSEGGAEKLLGNGDMLFKNSTMSGYERYQGAFISDVEISNVVNYIKENNEAYFDDDLANYLEKESQPKEEVQLSVDDSSSSKDIENTDIFKKSLALAIKTGSISISLLQRRFSIGFARAGSIVDRMERHKYIAENEGNGKGRKVLITREMFESLYGDMPNDI